MPGMRRREFVALLGGAAAAWPLAARAQQPAKPVIGLLGLSADPTAHIVAAFRQGLNETGFVEGRNVTVEYRWAEGQYDRLPALAAELVRRQVAVIVAGAPACSARGQGGNLDNSNRFLRWHDPVKLGLVASLDRPGGNVTGVSFFSTELAAKRLELLHDWCPRPPCLPCSSIRPLCGPIRLTMTCRLPHGNGSKSRCPERQQRTRDRCRLCSIVQLRAGALIVASDLFFISRAISLPPWQLAMQCRQFFSYVSMPRPVA